MGENPLGQWSGRVAGHPLQGVLLKLEALFVQAEEIVDEPDARSLLARARLVVERTRTALGSADPALVQDASLANLQAHLTNVMAEVHAFVSNRTPISLVSANAHADGVLTQLASIPWIAPLPSAEEIGQTVSSVRRASELALTATAAERKRMSDSLEQLRSQVEVLTATLASERARVDAAVSAFAAAEADRVREFGEGERKRSETSAQSEEARKVEYKTIEDARRSAADTLLSELKKEFEELSTMITADEQERSTHASASREEEQEAFAELLERLETEERKRADELKKSAGTTLEEIAEQRKRAVELLHVIGSTGMTAGYQQAVRREELSMWAWQGLTVASLIGLLVVAGLLAFGLKEITWPMVAGRIFVATSFAAVVGYAGRQAAVHRDSMLKSRQMALELASIDPYLEPLPVEIRHAVKKDIAERIFARPEQPQPTPPSVAPKEAAESVATLAKAVADVARGAKGP